MDLLTLTNPLGLKEQQINLKANTLRTSGLAIADADERAGDGKINNKRNYEYN